MYFFIKYFEIWCNYKLLNRVRFYFKVCFRVLVGVVLYWLVFINCSIVLKVECGLYLVSGFIDLFYFFKIGYINF